ncbi:MAG: FtsX-like permease family protein [Balneolaceae bacterium]|nr:FtsX-like permease family protein [Balneolaceae bacterium]
MNIFKLSYSYLKKSPLNTGLNVFLLALGIATITILLLFNHQFRNNLTQNAEGIDVVVGAKGSPIQLILSSVYHIDSPTGNISLEETQKILNHPMVEEAIPLALGDSHQGYRIVGTNRDYMDLYGASIREGGFWKYPKEVVAGVGVAEKLQLSIGDSIVSTHGLIQEGVAHDDKPLTVVGILENTDSILDRLILTSVKTVWTVHEHDDTEEEHEKDEHEHHHEKEHAEEQHDELTEPFDFITSENLDKELTSLLISYKSPLAGATFPRFVNEQTEMQAAAPGFEITRLLSLLGIGFNMLRIFGFILILAAMLGVFIALYNAMKERKYDLAVMRTLGGRRITLMKQILLEGTCLVLPGAILGIVLAHIGIAFLSSTYQQAEQFNINAWVFLPEEFLILGGAVLLGMLSSLVPAVIAFRTPISTTLSQQL